MLRDPAATPTLTCRRGRHVLRMPRLRFQTPTIRDYHLVSASASDAEAQRWLGWTAEYLIPEHHRENILARRPGRGRPGRKPNGGSWFLIAIDRASGRPAGAVGVQDDAGEVGGWLAPGFRSRGLGAELFAGAAVFGHHILGAAIVRAGTETTNAACIGALLSAGFRPADGPDVYELPDGRVVPSRWFRHDVERPGRCPAAPGH
jgi:RimJ/RimL family protein N-acetyltransferase